MSRPCLRRLSILAILPLLSLTGTCWGADSGWEGDFPGDSEDSFPLPLDDRYETVQDAVLTVSAQQGVLANDTNVASVTLALAPKHGQVALQADGSFVYRPTAGFSGGDQFFYSPVIAPEEGVAMVGLIGVKIIVKSAGGNTPPIVFDDGYKVESEKTLSVSATEGVLANDEVVGGGVLTLRVVTEPAHGTLQLHQDGSFEYTQNADFPKNSMGEVDFFMYAVKDGNGAESEGRVSLFSLGDLGGSSSKTLVLLAGIPQTDDNLTFAVRVPSATVYRWRLDAGAWHEGQKISTPIHVTGISLGEHRLEVEASNDDKSVTASALWTWTRGEHGTDSGSGGSGTDPVEGVFAVTSVSLKGVSDQSVKVNGISVNVVNGQWSSAQTTWPEEGIVHFEVTSGATTASINLLLLNNACFSLTSTN